MLWFILVIFLILTITLLAGKGSFLIAGYNTASPKEKARYDEKKLCRVMGSCMGVITLCLGIQAIGGEKISAIAGRMIPVIILIDIVVCIILGNTICVKRDVSEKSEKTEKSQKKTLWISVGFTVAVCGIVAVLLFTGDIKVSFTDTTMEIEGSYWSDTTVVLEQIQKVSYIEQKIEGSRTNGLGSFRLQEGAFHNEKFGSYTRYTYVGCEEYIVMETTGGILVVNQETEEATKKLYDEITQMR